jgi:Tfp pilus assembly protein PilN
MVVNKSNYISVLNSELIPLESLVAAENQKIAALEEESALITPQIAGIEAATGIFDNTFSALLEARIKVNGDMSQIVNLLPGNLNLTTVNHIGDMITVTGLSPDENGIFSYARALRNDGRFSTVVISSVEAIEEDEEIVGFNFEFLLR